MEFPLMPAIRGFERNRRMQYTVSHVMLTSDAKPMVKTGAITNLAWDFGMA
jgi:hypothetical protein